MPVAVEVRRGKGGRRVVDREPAALHPAALQLAVAAHGHLDARLLSRRAVGVALSHSIAHACRVAVERRQAPLRAQDLVPDTATLRTERGTQGLLGSYLAGLVPGSDAMRVIHDGPGHVERLLLASGALQHHPPVPHPRVRYPDAARVQGRRAYLTWQKVSVHGGSWHTPRLRVANEQLAAAALTSGSGKSTRMRGFVAEMLPELARRLPHAGPEAPSHLLARLDGVRHACTSVVSDRVGVRPPLEHLGAAQQMSAPRVSEHSRARTRTSNASPSPVPSTSSCFTVQLGSTHPCVSARLRVEKAWHDGWGLTRRTPRAWPCPSCSRM